jgi:hypothetical protein
MKRWREIDALRGVMLVMMTITHVPTRLSGLLGQPLGFVSAAEGFVFLSGFMASYVFSQRAAKSGVPAMHKAFLGRAAKLYACHVAMLFYLFTIIALIGISTDRQAIKNLISFYLQEPLTAIASSLILVYNPPLLDILPMYVLFMLVSPWLLAAGLRLSWKPVLTAGAAIWLCAQFGLARDVYEAARDILGLQVPFHETGAFDVFAWQLIWLMGLWLGAQTAAGRKIVPPHAIVCVAIFFAILGLGARYLFGQAPFSDHKMITMLLDKWRLGPLRLLNFLALAIVTIRFAPALQRTIRWRPLELLGAASLPVFCAHLVAVLFALALVGDKGGTTALLTELTLLAGTFAAMFGAAWAFQSKPRRESTAKPDEEVAVSARAGR